MWICWDCYDVIRMDVCCMMDLRLDLGLIWNGFEWFKNIGNRVNIAVVTSDFLWTVFVHSIRTREPPARL